MVSIFTQNRLNDMIVVREISKSFGNRKILDGISFELHESDRLGIVGESGSGKTTILRLIAGLDLPDKGEIHIDGSIVTNPRWSLEPHKRNLGFVFQSPALWPHMTVAQNILFGMDGTPKKIVLKRFNDLILRLKLSGLEKQYPDQLSAGEARRVSIARTFASKPKRILMDEPLTNLDPDLKELLLRFITEFISESGSSLIYVSHDRSEIERIVDRILYLENGKLSLSE